MKRFGFGLCFILAAACMLAGCQDGSARKSVPSPVAGDKLFVPAGYEKQLSKLHLTEVAALPYFSKPFIAIAKDASDREWAVVFQSADDSYKVELPVSYEEIQNKVEAQGYRVKGAALTNLIMFEYDKRLFWTFTDGTGTLYLDLDGNRTDPFAKKG